MFLIPVSPAPRKVPLGSLQMKKEREKDGRMEGNEERKEGGREVGMIEEEGREDRTKFLNQTLQRN